MFAFIIQGRRPDAGVGLLVAAFTLLFSAIAMPLVGLGGNMVAGRHGTEALLDVTMAISIVGVVLHWIFLVAVALGIAALTRPDPRLAGRHAPSR